MRPSILDPLFASVESLKGVGPRYAALIRKMCGGHLIDLLLHAPFRVVDRQQSPPIMQAIPGEVVTLEVEVQDVKAGRGHAPARVRAANESGFLDLVFFRAREDYLEKTFPIGARLAVSGTLDDYQGKRQMTHPDYVLPVERRDEIPYLEPVYTLTAGLHAKSLLKAIALALARVPALPEWNDPAFLRREGWMDWKSALARLHQPQDSAECGLDTKIRRRLAYDELLANQLALALTREKQRVLKGWALSGDGALRSRLLKQLPFTPTAAQQTAAAEIAADMASPNRMLRLLQGDVGSGKTLVALVAMLQAVEAGAQAALMAPTDLLAQQHAASLEKMLAGMDVGVTLLSGKLAAPARRAAAEKIASGAAHIIVGTHALFQDEVEFRDLGMAVIDEQHRFGVHQRLALSGKGAAPDLLVMTATPIPRTLTLTFYGDMDVSRLDEKPAGRRPIDTRAMPLSRLPDVVEAVRRKLETGEKVYWVCPLVDESEDSDLAAASARHADLAARLGEAAVRLVHGQMKPAARDAAMRDFAHGAANILVATTVIEVGVDVPQATLIVIEHAERFGLAQLHQLRGRAGRSDAASTCLLLYAEPLGQTARARLNMMRETNDGFKIAEEDLNLRGPGEMLGTRQSGMQEFRLADLWAHKDLLLAARDDVKMIIAKDADLHSERGKALRHLLYLFQYDQAIKTLRSG